MDIISGLIDKLKNSLFIIDEYHNLSINNLTNNDDPIYKLLASKNKILFLSATPRVYNLENSEYDDEYFKELIGEITYHMEFNYAIKNKIICDYKIFIPSISISGSNMITKISKELNIDLINDEYNAKSVFLFKCLTYHGSKKTIVYCKDKSDLDNLKKSLLKIKDYYLIDDLFIDEITESTPFSKFESKKGTRDYIINKFSTNQSKSILLSIKILDECIDIPSCDSVFLSYVSNSKIRTIQRICRSVRINKNNPFKISKIFFWCNSYEEILESISSLKEYDIELIKKINIQNVNLENNLNDDEQIKKDKILIDNYIVGIKEYKTTDWNSRLDELKKYLDTNKKRPSENDNNYKVVLLSKWLTSQKRYYKEKKFNLKKEDFYNKWTEFINKYKKYIITYDDKWEYNFNLLKEFIIKHNRKPVRKSIKKTNVNEDDSDEDDINEDDINDDNSDDDNDNSDDDNDDFGIDLEDLDSLKTEKFLGKWYQKQIYLFKNINNERSEKFFDFINKNKDVFKNFKDVWINNLQTIKKYLNDNKKRPSNKTKIGKWLCHQLYNYKNKSRAVYNNISYKNLWDKFYNDYNEYF